MCNYSLFYAGFNNAINLDSKKNIGKNSTEISYDGFLKNLCVASYQSKAKEVY